MNTNFDQYKRQTLFIIIVVLALFTVLGSGAFYFFERDKQLNHTREHATNEILVLAQLISPVMNNTQFFSVKKLASQWGGNHSELREIWLNEHDGETLVYQKDEKTSAYSINISHQFPLNEQQYYSLKLVWDTASVHQNLNHLLTYLMTIPFLLLIFLLSTPSG